MDKIWFCICLLIMDFIEFNDLDINLELKNYPSREQLSSSENFWENVRSVLVLKLDQV